MLCDVIAVMVIQMSTKTYSEMMTFNTFEERFNYLKLSGRVGADTFGYDRIFNQVLYKSQRWRSIRDKIIIRDNGCDLGVEGRDINGRILIHHINPITLDDILRESSMVFDPENLVCVSHLTHNAIHYSDDSILVKDPIERSKHDTCPWKR